MAVEVRGLDRFERQLRDFENRLEDAGGEVPVDEVLHPEFVRSYTEFDSFDDLLAHSRWVVRTTEDFERIPEDEFDEYVDEHTKFDDWETMLSVATREYILSSSAVEE